DWSRRVEEVVQSLAAEGVPMLEGPIIAWVTFWVPKPRSAPKRRRTWPDRKPDLDKLCRAIMDPCSGVLIRDDAQIVEFICLRKLYADEDLFDHRPRAEVRLWRAADLEPQREEVKKTNERPGGIASVMVGKANP
ncbi:MAG: RusA family crossover junction endodeoxyribonuclease, partial [Actinomycetota bacterium]